MVNRYDLRFKFGRNWRRYSDLVDSVRINKAKLHLQDRFDEISFNGCFLDIGCGSGVFSAAASLLEAKVYAFDYDKNSVKTSHLIIDKYGKKDNILACEIGDVLSQEFKKIVPTFQYIYSWGVLHHTGDLWSALSNVADSASAETKFVLSIYNDLGRETDNWEKLKKAYVRFIPLRPLIIFYAWYRFWAKQQFRSLITGNDPFKSWREYAIDSRGMSAWYDLVDWSGGYPYQRATIEEVKSFMEKRGWTLLKTWPNQGIGCNEFLFKKN